ERSHRPGLGAAVPAVQGGDRPAARDQAGQGHARLPAWRHATDAAGRRGGNRERNPEEGESAEGHGRRSGGASTPDRPVQPGGGRQIADNRGRARSLSPGAVVRAVGGVPAQPGEWGDSYLWVGWRMATSSSRESISRGPGLLK